MVAAVEHCKKKDSRVKFIHGDPQFTYYGRFFQGLGVQTRWVAVFDDDSVPGYVMFGSFYSHFIA